MIQPPAYDRKISCSVEILTRNSAVTLEKCLESVKDFAEIIILDGNSTDHTLEIARKYGCRIYKQYETSEPEIIIKDYAEVRNKGLGLANYDWFLYIDSDEYLSAEVVEEIRSVVESPRPEFFVWWQPRKYILDGKIIDCATTYPNQQIRFFHKKAVKQFVKPIHEKIEILAGESAGALKNFELVPLEKLSSLKEKWQRYFNLEEKRLIGLSRSKIILGILHILKTILVYNLRLISNFIFCRGKRLPLFYELARQGYNFSLLFLLFRKLIRNEKSNAPLL